jgi:exopolysaccharide biosynthesis predicted pyruvyltransferase EpsI
MQARAVDAFTLLHQDVREVILTQFPDYANVGDSAIVLGEWSF